MNYDLLPEHLREGMMRYFEHGIEPGSFLRAALENNFWEVVMRADAASAAGFLGIARFLSSAPGHCWGSPSTVSAWIERHRQQRMAAQ